MLVGFKALKEKFTSRVVKHRPDELQVTYVDGPLRDLDNVWRFRNVGGGCEIDFAVDFAFRNPLFEKIANLPSEQQLDVYSLNVPFSWGEIVTADAYVRYRFDDRFSAELVGTNLNDRYYADPLTRSLMPAPGRTVRLSLTGRF